MSELKIKVKIGSAVSDKFNVHMETLQGGVIDQLISILFVNNITTHNIGRIFLYADHIFIIISGPNINNLKSEIEVIFELF